MSSTLKKSIFSVLLVVVMGVLFALPTAAQDAPADTVTVNASAFASGTPTQANIELGVEIFGESVKDSFAQSNETVRAIYDALIGLGIAETDIQTANLSVYSNIQYSPEGMERKGYQVNNTVRVLIRDIAKVDGVIDAAIAAGATSMYGLSFSITDTASLETEARAAAFAVAQTRATELAALSGATLGEVVSIREDFGGSPVFAFNGRAQGGGGSDSAFVATGQTDVTVGLTVTFKLSR
jgi:hypothetical protein